jgi:hypothetical protein
MWAGVRHASFVKMRAQLKKRLMPAKVSFSTALQRLQQRIVQIRDIQLKLNVNHW